MFNKGKYLVGDITDGFFTGKVAICFPDHIGHSRMKHIFDEGTIVSGGFVGVDEAGVVHPYGESVSLGVKSNPEQDTRLLEQALGIN